MNNDKSKIEIEKKLEELKELDNERQIIQLDKQAAVNAILTDEIKEKLDEIEVYYKSALEHLNELSNYIEHEIKSAVLDNGASVKGIYHAIYVKGRVTWNSKALDGYALAHPEINKMRKTGKPSVRIKR